MVSPGLEVKIHNSSLGSPEEGNKPDDGDTPVLTGILGTGGWRVSVSIPGCFAIIAAAEGEIVVKFSCYFLQSPSSVADEGVHLCQGVFLVIEEDGGGDQGDENCHS